MGPSILFAVLVNIMGLLRTESCDPKIVNRIKANIRVNQGEDFMQYITNKVFLNVWIARKHLCTDCIQGSVSCAWTKVIQDQGQGNSPVTIQHFFRAGLISKEILTSGTKVLERLEDGKYLEKRALKNPEDELSDVPEYVIYPIYYNKEEGTIAYHRCRVNKKHPWYTVIAVQNEKFSTSSDYDKFSLGQPNWRLIFDVRAMITSLRLKHHWRSGKALVNPYGCKNRIHVPGL